MIVAEMDYLSFLILAIHVICAVALIGGALIWRFAVLPAMSPMADETRAKTDDAVAAAWRPVTIACVAGLLLTGIYNLMHRPVQTPQFHILFGIKMLLALHIFAVSLVATRPGNARRARRLTGIAISGVVVLLISAAFRWV
jgi:hypothetical protein